MSLLVYTAGSGLLAVLTRWWCPRLGWRWIAGYWLLAGAFFAAPLTTPAVQVPADIVYRWLPWRDLHPQPVVPANDMLWDVPLQLLPFRALVADRLLRLDPPLWSHEIGTGEPLLGNAISAPFSPLVVLTLPLAPVRALPVTVALRLFLSLMLTHCLLLELGAGVAGAAFAALAFTFSVFSICWALHPHGTATAWLPGIFLGLTRLRRGGRGGLGGLVVCGTGLALSGHPETLAHACLAAGIVVAGMLCFGGAPRWPFVGRLAVAAAITVGLSAPVLLPVVEVLPESMRSQAVAQNPALVQPPAFEVRSLRVVVDPLAFGSPRDGNYDGPWNYLELCSGYAGLLALALAAAAALALRGWPLAIFGGGAAALAAAFAVPPFLALVRALPLFDRAANGRLRLFWALAVAVVAGLGLERLAASRGGRLAAATAAGVATLALVTNGPPAATWQRAWWLATAAGCGVTAAAFAGLGLRMPRPHGSHDGDPTGVLRAGRAAPGDPSSGGGPPAGPAAGALSGGWLPWLAVAALALDLGLLETRFLPVLPAAFDLAPPPPIVVLLRERLTGHDTPFRVMATGFDLPPNLASFYGLWDPRANDPMQPARAALIVRSRLRAQDALRSKRPYPQPFLDFLGVRYMLTGHEERLGAPWLQVWEGPGGKLWRNPGALPLFFMPAGWRVARDPSDALRFTLVNQDFAAGAVAELPDRPAVAAAPVVPGLPVPPATALPAVSLLQSAPALPAARSAPEIDRLAAPGPAGDAWRQRWERGTVRIRRVRASGFDLDVATPTGGVTASSVTWCRGWRLILDGRAAPLLRVNGAFLGFLSPPGEHHASLDYRPAGWIWGLRLGGLTLAAVAARLAALAASALVARRRPATADAG